MRYITIDSEKAYQDRIASLQLLAKADIAYFAPGWEDARGCKIENTCAKEYGIQVIE